MRCCWVTSSYCFCIYKDSEELMVFQETLLLKGLVGD